MVTVRSIGASIREARIDAGLTQKQLAQIAGLSERTLISIEMGASPGVGLGKVLSVLSQLGLDLQVASAKQMSRETFDTEDCCYDEAFEAASSKIGIGAFLGKDPSKEASK